MPAKVRIVKAMVFPVVTYSCDSWTVKKAQCWRIDAFELWCWRRLPRVPWTARRSNQSILRKINPEYLLEDWCWSWNCSILVIWLKQLTCWKSPWCCERLRAEGEEGVRGDGWMASPMQWTWTWANFRRWWGTGRPGMLLSIRACKESDMTGWLNNNKWFPTNHSYAKMDIPNTSDVSSEERNPDFHPNFKSSSPFRMLIRLIFKNLTTLYKLKLNKHVGWLQPAGLRVYNRWCWL